jgi:hypothetical protein
MRQPAYPRRTAASACYAAIIDDATCFTSAISSRHPRHATAFDVGERTSDVPRLNGLGGEETWTSTTTTQPVLRGESTRCLHAPIRFLPNRRTNSGPRNGSCTTGRSARCGRDTRISVGWPILFAQHTHRSSSLARLAAAVAITWRHRVIQETRLSFACANCRIAARMFTAQNAPEC